MTQECIHEMYRYIHPILPEDTINISDKFSGTRLMAEMRKKLPGILPSVRKEKNTKNRYKSEFNAVFLA